MKQLLTALGCTTLGYDNNRYSSYSHPVIRTGKGKLLVHAVGGFSFERLN